MERQCKSCHSPLLVDYPLRWKLCETCRGKRANTHYKSQSFEERFWSYVEKTETCWLWQVGRLPKGYGLVAREGERFYAHRMAWELAHGPIPDGLWVLHNCPDGDNPSCVNPDHLFLGTEKDNSVDMVSKGRHKPFTGGRTHKMFDAEQIIDIRRRHALGERLIDIASSYNQKKALIWKIVERRIYQNVPETEVA